MLRTFPRRTINRIDFGTDTKIVPSEYMSNTNSQVVAAQGAGNPQSGNTSIATTVTVVRPISRTTINTKTGAEETYVYKWYVYVKDSVPGMIYNSATKERKVVNARYFEMFPSVMIAQLADFIPELAFAGTIDAENMTLILNQAAIEFTATHHDAGDEYTDMFGNTQLFKNEGFSYQITEVQLCDRAKAFVGSFASAASDAALARITKKFSGE